MNIGHMDSVSEEQRFLLSKFFRLVLFLVFCVMLLALQILIEDSGPIRIAFIILLYLYFITIEWKAIFTTCPGVVINKRGMTIHSYGSGVSPWSEIEAIQIRGENVVRIKSKNNHRSITDLDPIQRLLVRWVTYPHCGLLVIRMSSIQAEIHDLRAAITAHGPPGLITREELCPQTWRRSVILLVITVIGAIGLAYVLDFADWVLGLIIF